MSLEDEMFEMGDHHRELHVERPCGRREHNIHQDQKGNRWLGAEHHGEVVRAELGRLARPDHAELGGHVERKILKF